MKDFDNFRNTDFPLPYHGNLPPGGHPPAGGPESPFGMPPFFGPPGHFRPPLPMTLETFKEMKYFMTLMILSDNPEGITGYQFQERFNIPRGNVLRIMDDLVKLDYVTTSKSVITGRAQKFFIITEKGKEYLNELKEKWSARLAQMTDFTGSDMMSGLLMRKALEMILMHQVDKLKSKDDALDLFRGLRFRAKTFIAKMTERLDLLKRIKSELDSMVQAIEKKDNLDLEEIKKSVEEFKNKLDEQLQT